MALLIPLAAAIGYVIARNPRSNCRPLPWPSTCTGWAAFLPAGYPTVAERGAQAENMVNDNAWWNSCTDAQMDYLAATTYAYGLNSWDVATAVEGIDGNIKDKQILCQVANVIETPPSNPCQASDWKNNYMSTMDSKTQGLLNKWKGYC